MNRHCTFFLAMMLGVCLFGGISCQQGLPAGGSVGVRNYSDAVVHIGQVDPAYRAYFRDQNAANYSLSDQRKAYFAAARTARTPVRESDYQSGVVRSRSSVRGKGRARVVRKATVKKSRQVAVRRRSTSKRR